MKLSPTLSSRANRPPPFRSKRDQWPILAHEITRGCSGSTRSARAVGFRKAPRACGDYRIRVKGAIQPLSAAIASLTCFVLILISLRFYFLFFFGILFLFHSLMVYLARL